MDDTRSLTEFQQKCEGELRFALAARSLALTDRTFAGESETYTRASVRGTHILVYIYEDETQFHRAEKLAGLFEQQDSKDAAHLQKAFICGVVKVAHDR